MKAIVVDTNVLVVANGKTEQAGPECVLACVDALQWVVGKAKLVLDEKMLIFEEYSRHCSFKGQPGVGDAFFKWVFDHCYNDARCERVALTPHATREYVEFPDDPELAEFDHNDRKFVAVALASAIHPSIVNAVDSDWWNHQKTLKHHGVKIKFLCPDQFDGE